MCSINQVVINREIEITTPREFQSYFGILPDPLLENIGEDFSNRLDECLCPFDVGSTLIKKGIKFTEIEGEGYFIE